jgi:hypothetical protein
MLAGGLIGLAAAGCGDEFTSSDVMGIDSGTDSGATGGAGGAGGAAGEGGVGATGGKAGAGGQPCDVKVTFASMNTPGAYVENNPPEINVKENCISITPDCPGESLKKMTAKEVYSGTGLLETGTVWKNGVIIKSGVSPANISSNINALVFANLPNADLPAGEATIVCVGGSIKLNAEGNAKLNLDVGGVETTNASNPTALNGNQFDAN